jgi:signal transduction histidine kinase
MRRRILEAGAFPLSSLIVHHLTPAPTDRAKLAFVSQISHELRTPLHGIGSQIELIREVSAPATLKKLKPLLDVADVCIASLREVSPPSSLP